MIQNEQIDILELLKRTEQVSQIAGDAFGDNLFIETQVMLYAVEKKMNIFPALLIFIDGLDTVAFNNAKNREPSIRDASSQSKSCLLELAHAYIAIMRPFFSRTQIGSFHKSTTLLLKRTEPENETVTLLRRLTLLPSSGREYQLSAIHGKSHAIKNRYITSVNSHLELRDLLHHVIGHSKALGYGISNGKIILGNVQFKIWHHGNPNGTRYFIANNEHGATTQISHTNPYTIHRKQNELA